MSNPFEAPLHTGAGSADLGPLHVLFGFDGRIARRHYWAGTLGATALFYGTLFGVAVIAGENDTAFGAVTLLLYVPFIWTNLALQIKRWHDRGKSGFFVLVNLIPIVGPLYSFIELGMLRGDQGRNEFGVDPT